MNPSSDIKLFESIRESLDTIKRSQEKTDEAQEKIIKLSNQIQVAQEFVVRAEEKRDAILRKNTFLREKLNKLDERKIEAFKYWQDYGFDVKEVVIPGDDCQHYEFIYSKLNGQELLQPITIVVRLEDKTLQIVSRLPNGALRDQDIQALNSKLIGDCHPGDDHVDFKLAMLRIRKALIIPDP